MREDGCDNRGNVEWRERKRQRERGRKRSGTRAANNISRDQVERTQQEKEIPNNIALHGIHFDPNHGGDWRRRINAKKSIRAKWSRARVIFHCRAYPAMGIWRTDDAIGRGVALWLRLALGSH